MNETGMLVEGFVLTWLESTDAGHKYVEQFGMEEAIDAIFELLNAGFLKIAAEGEMLIDLVPLNPPIPPTTKLERKK